MARPSTVLLLSADPMAAALLGLLAEMAGYQPAFPTPDEPPEEAVARVRPLFVILVDGSLDVARSDLFFGSAARRRVGLAVLRSRHGDVPLAAWARDRHVPCVDVPITTDQFARVVDTAHASNWWRSDRDRRRVPLTERAANGMLVYVDRSGHRWRVYDRRGHDRRQLPDEQTAMSGWQPLQPPVQGLAPSDSLAETPAQQIAEVAERLFIGESGEAWQCALPDTEVAHLSPAVLERQLTRAIRLSAAPELPGQP